EISMQIIDININNIDNEHICCSISEKKGENCVFSKKAWMKNNFDKGLVFKRFDVRGKAFIEYIPAENAWCPITADNYIFINCFWISGKFKGQGYSNLLLQECVDDAKSKGKYGLVVLSSSKKMPFLSDAKYLKYKGFCLADTSEPNYELLYFPFTDNAPIPYFKNCVKKRKLNENGIVLYYSNQCPHTEKYAPILKKIANSRGIDVNLIKFETAKEAQNAPAPFTTYSLFFNGEFVTNEILSEKKIEKFLDTNIKKFN
ncbi:N-acetyltransferase, partial [Clostridioides difficile]